MQYDPFQSSRDLGMTWPEVKLWPWPFKVIVYMVRRALTRQTRWHQNSCSIFNPRTAGGLSHLRTAGGATYVPPPPANSNTTQRIDKRKKALDRSEQALEKVLRSFLCEVKIEVTRGHEGQNFPKFPNYMTWLHIMRIISVPVTATSKFKKAIESSWNALSLRWRQISPKTNGLGVRGHERSKTAFLSETVFRW